MHIVPSNIIDSAFYPIKLFSPQLTQYFKSDLTFQNILISVSNRYAYRTLYSGDERVLRRLLTPWLVQGTAASDHPRRKLRELDQ